MQTLRRHARWLLVMLPVLCLTAVMVWVWPQPRQAAYAFYRSRGKERTISTLQGYKMHHSEHFELFYTPADEDMVNWVLSTAESVYEPVVGYVPYAPEARVPLIVYPTRDTMRRAFGWPKSQSAMGVYWQGTIRLLSPHEWLPEGSEADRRRVFEKLNPIAHELTHFVVDHMTQGNYPRWFTEGLAQWTEHEITGYLWLDSDGTVRQPLYSYQELMGDYDQLSSQPLAYRQSYLLVRYLIEEYGEGQLWRLMESLSTDQPFDRALQHVYGRTGEQLYADWIEWVEWHLDDLDPPE